MHFTRKKHRAGGSATGKAVFHGLSEFCRESSLAPPVRLATVHGHVSPKSYDRARARQLDKREGVPSHSSLETAQGPVPELEPREIGRTSAILFREVERDTSARVHPGGQEVTVSSPLQWL